MIRMIIDISRYVLAALILVYSLQSFLVFRKQDEDAREFLFLRQNVVMFCIHFVAFMVLYLRMAEPMLLFFYGAQVIYLASTLVFYRNLYPTASKLLVNNMCMLITIGFIMITRLSYDESIRQFKILVIGTVLSLLVPILVRKVKILAKGAWLYAIGGLGLLAAVAVLGRVTGGAKLLLSIGSFSLQPSEFVKISFAMCVAGMLSRSTKFPNVVLTTIIAAAHVLILVVSTDLGSALIYFAAYLVVLYVATRDWRYLAAGGASRCGSSSGCLCSIFPCKDPCVCLEGSFRRLLRKRLPDCSGIVCHRSRGLVRHRAVYGYAGTDSYRGRLYVCSDFGRAGQLFRSVYDSDLYELLCYVCKRCPEDERKLLPSYRTVSWMHFCGADIFNCGRCHENDPHDWCDPAVYQPRRKLHFKYADYVCSCPGNVHYQRR